MNKHSNNNHAKDRSIRVSIIGTAGIPAAYGGFETLAENLVRYKRGPINYTVFCSGRRGKEQPQMHNGARLKYLPISANGMSSVIYDFISMIFSLKQDVLLVLGVSGCLLLPFFRLLYRGIIITNIDGIEWKRQKWSAFARMVLRCAEMLAIRFSDTIIADNSEIQCYVYTTYRHHSCLIEYGSDHFTTTILKPDTEKFPFLLDRYAVVVCRIEPENNIHLILESFSKIQTCQLVAIGNWSNNQYSKRLYNQYNNHLNIKLLPPIYIANEINTIRSNAVCYIHGHSAGGTNPSLVEAMSLGLPVFAYDCAYNRATTENSASYWSSSMDLERLLESIDVDRNNYMGLKLKAIAQRRYRWDTIVDKYEEIFMSRF